MVGWEAANIIHSSDKNESISIRNNVSETPDAALARLTESYSAAMDAVTALHKVSRLITTERSISSNKNNESSFEHDTKLENLRSLVQRTSKAARGIMENGILSDSLVQPYLKKLSKVLLQQGIPSDGRNIRYNPDSLVKLSSSSQRKTLEKIIYLTLVNYADLLTCVCTCGVDRSSHKNNAILVRGVVDLLPHFTHLSSSRLDACIWGENEEVTKRLALVSYCEAADLDGSDPMIWLKIASSAHNLGFSELGIETNEKILPRFMRLERYALERGLTTLPTNAPSNPCLSRGLKEHLQNIRDATKSSLSLDSYTSNVVLEVSLPNLSWSALGRLLIRVCKEGGCWAMSNEYQGFNRPKFIHLLGSPTIKIKVSSILTLPHKILGRICEYLTDEAEHSDDLKNLESTCRSLSSAVASFRAYNQRLKFSSREMETHIELSQEQRNLINVEDSLKPGPQRSHRLSTRLRSQTLISGKQSDRTAKRTSVRNALALIVTSHSEDHPHYLSLVKESKTIEWLPWCPFANELGRIGSGSNDQDSLVFSPKNTDNSMHSDDDAPFCLELYRLKDFLRKVNSNNSGPRYVLNRYLSYISQNVQEVYCPLDERTRIVLSSCLLDCTFYILHLPYYVEMLILFQSEFDQLGFDFLLKDSQRPSWYGDEMADFASDDLSGVETFSINLLLAELRLRRAERCSYCVHTVNDDINILKFMVPKLRHLCACTVDDFHHKSKIVKGLIVRTNWLSASFFMWMANSQLTTSEIHESESLAIQNIDCILSFIDQSSDSVIHTPHLSRSGKDWCQLSVSTVRSVREELQLKAVLSSCRFKFLQFVTNIHTNSIGICSFVDEELLARYNLNADDGFGHKHRELITDFISINADGLLANSGENVEPSDPRRWSFMWDMIMTVNNGQLNTLKVDCPALLTVISYCLATKESFERRMLYLLIALVVHCLKQRQELVVANTVIGSDVNDEEMQYDSNESSPGYKSSDMIRKNTLLFLIAAKFFLAKAQSMLHENKYIQVEVINQFVESGGLSFLVKGIFGDNVSGVTESIIDEEIAKMVLNFVSFSLGLLSHDLRERSVKSVGLWMSRFIVSEEWAFSTFFPTCCAKPDNRLYSYEKICYHTKLCSMACSELTMLITENMVSCKGGFFLDNVMDTSTYACIQTTSPLIPLIESLHSLWGLVLSMASETHPVRVKMNVRTAVKDMLSPVASLIISISVAVVLHHLKEDQDVLNRYSVEDTDCSSDESSQETRNSSSDVNKYEKKTRIHQMVAVVTQCSGLVLSSVDDKEASECFQTAIVSCHDCPLLPKTAARALGSLADLVLTNNTSRGKWSEEYPPGFRSSGYQMDAFLCMAYRLLYGITLTPQSNIAIQKDIVLPLFNSSNTAVRESLPESIGEASQLYRCIMRVYRTGRRLPPKAALDCVMRSLPTAEDTVTAKAIKIFIWNKVNDDTALNACESDVLSILDDKYCLEFPRTFPLTDDFDSRERDDDCRLEEIEIVRRGIVDLLAKGPIPRQSVHESNSRSDIVDEREQTFQTEKLLSQKVMALIDSICFRPENYESWFHLGLCLSIKAELVSDRLPPFLAQDKRCAFLAPEIHRLGTTDDCDTSSMNDIRLPLRELLKTQFSDFRAKCCSRVETIGEDLSFYAKNEWANFHNLEYVTRSMRVDPEEHNIFLTIRALYEEGKFYDWQSCWGRLFISALHVISKRCLRVALALYNRKSSVIVDEGIPYNEDIAEALGTAYYNDIMGGVSCGYPSIELSPFEKRFLAKRAIVCFQLVIDYGLIRNKTRRWDLHFMIGKCYEKISSTLLRESFPKLTPRAYEIVMKKALENFATADAAAKNDSAVGEKKEGGGSSHGQWEVIYRLHASRFKALLRYVRSSTFDRSMAGLEALRITENTDTMDATLETVKARVWDVLCDIARTFAHCKKQNPFFHRSVYRHAQALLWSPAFLEDWCDNSEEKRTQMRKLIGADCEKTCTENAKAIIETLFDRKRMQLCAIWVTTPPSPEPFELLNDAARKYDSLRWKYSLAYIDCLRLCKDLESLETFMTWIDSSARDLPSFYEKSASAKGAAPKSIHSKDNLLLSGTGIIADLTRHTNEAVADVIRQRLCAIDSSQLESGKDLLYHAYRCFRRLNCHIGDDVWKSLNIRKRLEQQKIAEVEAICDCYTFMEKGASLLISSCSRFDSKMLLLKKAVEICESSFSTRTEQATGKKKTLKRKVPEDES